jgi:alpha-tubulin suppressor-like RCC1 family protein
VGNVDPSKDNSKHWSVNLIRTLSLLGFIFQTNCYLRYTEESLNQRTQTTDLRASPVPSPLNSEVPTPIVTQTPFPTALPSPTSPPTPPPVPTGTPVDLSGLPSNPSSDLFLNITVGGNDILKYKFKLGLLGSIFCETTYDYSAETDVSQSILSGLASYGDGYLKLCVIGKNTSGEWRDPALATTYEWLKNSSGLQMGPPLIINGPGVTLTQGPAVMLSILSTGTTYSEMYITNQFGCTSGGIWEPISATKPWNLEPSQQGQLATVYAKFRNSSLQETACGSDSIAWNFSGSICTQTTSQSKAGVLFDVGGAYGDYLPLQSCSFTIDPQNPTLIRVKKVGLSDADLSFYDNTSYVNITNTPPSTETTIYDFSQNTTTTLNLQNQSYEFVFNDGPITFDFDSNLSHNSGFEISWSSNTSPFVPLAEREKSILFSMNDRYTSTNPVELSILGPGMTEMYITNQANCDSGGSWEPITNLKNWNLNSGDGLKTIYFKFRNADLAESQCESNSIQLDTTPPLAPLYIGHGVSNSGTRTPAIWVTNYEPFETISKMEVRIIKFSDQSVIANWRGFFNGEELSGSVLENGIAYQFEVRIYDEVGLQSSASKSEPWYIRPIVQIEEVTSTLLSENSGTVSFKAKIKGTNGGTISVPYIVRGEASNPSDHNLNAGVITFSPGQNEKTVSFQLNNDAITEVTERLIAELTDQDLISAQFNFALSNLSRLEFLIHDDDNSVPIPNITQLQSNCFVADGGVKCWGQPLGLGSLTTYYNTPTAVYPAGSGVTDVIVSDGFSSYIKCVLKSGGLNCWGSSGVGLFATGSSYAAYSIPVALYPAGSNITKVVMDDFICILKNQGVYCWGDNHYGSVGNGTQTNVYTPYEVFPELSGVTDIVSNGSTVCIIINSGLRCWGQNNSGEMGNGTTGAFSPPVTVFPDGSLVTKVILDESRLYAIVNGEIKAWGYNYSGSLGIGSATNLVTTPVTAFAQLGTQISDINSQCAIVDGGVYCWGRIYVGTNLTAPYDTTTPIPIIPKNSSVTEIKNGCAVVNGGVKCFKYFFGPLGDGEAGTTRSEPLTIVPEGSGAHGLIATGSTSGPGYCVIIQSDIKCWGQPPGYTTYGGSAWGHGMNPNSETPSWVIPSNSGVTALARNSNCAIVQGGIQCWGEVGKTASDTVPRGDGSLSFKNSPLNIIKAGSQVSKIWGDEHTGCYSILDGLNCWGRVGLSPVYLSTIQIEAEGTGIGEVSLVQSSRGICYIKNGGLICNNSTKNYAFEDFFPPLSGVTQHKFYRMGMSYTHDCVIKNGGVFCWGSNSYGQLGLGHTNASNVPLSSFPELSGATHIGLGRAFTCAVVNGGVYCWGLNDRGQIGNGNQINQLSPVNIFPEGSQAIQVECGYDHTCALFADGGVKCWGRGLYGQLANGGVSDSSTPVTSIPPGGGATYIYLNYLTSIAIVNGGLKYWGWNPLYGVGLPSTYYILNPKVAFPEGSNITPEKFNHAGGLCAVIDGGVQCAGDRTMNTSNLTSPSYGVVWIYPTW